jgi:signal transduction histidine kinase
LDTKAGFLKPQIDWLVCVSALINKSNEFENLLASALNDGISAAKTLAFFVQNNEEVAENFADMGRQILESNPQVNVIQLLDSGTIVAICPMLDNEAVLGYNVPKDPKNNTEAEESILKKEFYFSGPIDRKQSEKGVVGRYPRFEEGNLLVQLTHIKAVKTPIQIVFQNLVGNALKYRRPAFKPQLKISGRELEEFWEFSIKDNGIGIDGDYLEHIFGILKRLHPKEKYPGTGMGLATCRKIIAQHGGKIWAESASSPGSKFLFTIKKHE